MVESYNRMVHNRVADWPQIYLKEGASQLQQRIWLNSLLLKYDQAKEDGISRYITKHVLNIAQYFLDADEIDVPPAHIMAELLSTQRIPNMPRVIQRQLNSYLSARTRELELSSTTLAQMDEAALAQKLRDNLRDKKLSPAIIGSIIKYYQAKISAPHREVWNAAQAQAVSLLIDSIDPKLHTDLKIPTYVGSNAAISLVSLQGSLLIQSLFAYVYPELYPVVEKPTPMPAAVTTEESDSSQCVAHTATVLPPDKLSGDQGTSADSFPHPVNAHSQGLSAVERAAKIRKGKLILDHHRAKKPSHVAETGGEHMEALHNFPQHLDFSAQSEVILSDSQQQSEQIQEIVVADRQEFVSCENQEQVFAKDAKVADSEESATEHVKEADTKIADRQELNLRCYPTEEKLNVPQLIIIEQERIIVSPELKAADFIEAGISGYNNISGEEQETTKDHFIDKIKIETSDVISAKSIMVGESVANDVIIGKSADTFRGGTYFNYLNDLTPADVYADYYQRKNLYQQTTADVIKTEAKSESPVYYPLKDSDRIKNVYKEVLNLELKVEDKDMHETKYGKFAFQEAMRDNPEISALAGAIEDRALSVVGG